MSLQFLLGLCFEESEKIWVGVVCFILLSSVRSLTKRCVILLYEIIIKRNIKYLHSSCSCPIVLLLFIYSSSAYFWFHKCRQLWGRHNSYEVYGRQLLEDKCVRLHLCLLASPLGCHGFGFLINPARLEDIRAAPSSVGCMPSLLIRPGLPQKVCQLSTKPTSFAGHHLDSQQLNANMRLTVSSLVRQGRGA